MNPGANFIQLMYFYFIIRGCKEIVPAAGRAQDKRVSLLVSFGIGGKRDLRRRGDRGHRFRVGELFSIARRQKASGLRYERQITYIYSL